MGANTFIQSTTDRVRTGHKNMEKSWDLIFKNADLEKVFFYMAMEKVMKNYCLEDSE